MLIDPLTSPDTSSTVLIVFVGIVTLPIALGASVLELFFRTRQPSIFARPEAPAAVAFDRGYRASTVARSAPPVVRWRRELGLLPLVVAVAAVVATLPTSAVARVAAAVAVLALFVIGVVGERVLDRVRAVRGSE